RARERLERLGGFAIGRADLIPVSANITETSAELSQRLHTAIDSAGAEHPLVVLRVREWSRDRDVRRNFAAQIADLAAALYGNAGLAVVLEAASDADCQATFSAQDELRDASREDSKLNAMLWVPPFLVLGASGRPQWCGASRELRRLMYRLLE